MKATFAIVFAALFVASVFGDGQIKCPPVNDVDVTILPNPDDCKTFYICNEGVPFLMSCPPGQEFNSELRVCDLPEHANCVPLGHKPSTSPKPTTAAPETSPTTPTTAAPETSPTAEPPKHNCDA